MDNTRREFLRGSAWMGLAAVAAVATLLAASLSAAEIAVPPQVFEPGGWKCDVQFMDTMGSPYLLAHGLGVPCADAKALVTVPEAGVWRVWVRARNWSEGAPGAFRLRIGGKTLARTFGVSQAEWAWEDGGEVTLEAGRTELALRDLTGFDGRCAGVVLTKDAPAPTGPLSVADAVPDETVETEFCIVGGGVPGCAAAVAAARSGVRTVLLQDRPFLGGNASQEVRIWCAGEGKSNPIIESLRGLYYNGVNGAEVGDAMRHDVIRREENIDLRLRNRVFGATTAGGRIVSVKALDWGRNLVVEVKAKYFLDATGDGWLGHYAGADWKMGREAKEEFGEPLYGAEKADGDTLGASLCWYSQFSIRDVPFSAPWAEKHACGVEALKGDWNWEYGIHRDMIAEGEAIRDRLFLAVYGSFSLAKRHPENSRAVLSQVPFILGKRESRRLMGDYVFTENDVVKRIPHADAIAKCSWPIDLHFDDAVPGIDFKTRCTSTMYGRSYVPFRSIYSRNIANLMMAGRCFSCSHVGLGSPRVINTLSQMGLAAGYAAAIMKREGLLPKDLPGKGFVREIQRSMGGDWPGNPDPAHRDWKVVDDEDGGVDFGAGWEKLHRPNGEQFGDFTHFAASTNAAPAVYPLPIGKAGVYELFGKVPYHPWPEDQATGEVALEIRSGGRTVKLRFDEYRDMGNWISLGRFELDPGATLSVVPAESTAKNNLYADGFAVREIK